MKAVALTAAPPGGCVTSLTLLPPGPRYPSLFLGLCGLAVALSAPSIPSSGFIAGSEVSTAVSAGQHALPTGAARCTHTKGKPEWTAEAFLDLRSFSPREKGRLRFEGVQAGVWLH